MEKILIDTTLFLWKRTPFLAKHKIPTASTPFSAEIQLAFLYRRFQHL
jgi:hypothetical protein